MKETKKAFEHEVGVDGTRRTLSFVRQCGARKLLFVSSGAVYGDPPASLRDLSEDYSGGPDVTGSSAAYGEAKRAEELLCVLHGREHGFETKIARAFAFVGPYLRLARRSRWATSYATGSMVVRFASRVMAPRAGRICMLPTWRFSSGRFS